MKTQMNPQKLVNYIRSVLPMSIADAMFFANQFNYLEVDKDKKVLQEGYISKSTFFLEEGYIRSCTTNSESEEITTNLFSPPYFVNDFLSFFKQTPGTEDYKTITKCKLWEMDYETVQKNFHTYPEFREFGRLMLVNNYSRLHDRVLGMIKNTAEQRYVKLITAHPDIFQNVPLKIIASYLGVTDSSLSRIRKELIHKKDLF